MHLPYPYLPFLPLPVCMSVCLACYQGYLYAIGGNNGTASLDTCERYDPHLNKWSAVEPMKKRRAGAGVAELHGYLYVVGPSVRLFLISRLSLSHYHIQRRHYIHLYSPNIW